MIKTLCSDAACIALQIVCIAKFELYKVLLCLFCCIVQLFSIDGMRNDLMREQTYFVNTDQLKLVGKTSTFIDNECGIENNFRIAASPSYYVSLKRTVC